MPLQNRVDPWGNLVAVSARGEFLGNRGILHDENKTIVKPWTHKNWVTCKLSFKGIKRELFAPNSYTELFFLDEATALSAGHRPCAHCRRQRYNDFKRLWGVANDVPSSTSVSSKEIDNQLHLERVNRERIKVLFSANFGSVPEGAFIEIDGEAYLVWGGNLYQWQHHGYAAARRLPTENETVQVITPKTIVQMYQMGFKPSVHESISRFRDSDEIKRPS